MAAALPPELCCRLIEKAADAILFADPEGIIRLWNASAEAMFGYSAEEALGQSLDLIIGERLRARHWEGWHKVMATGNSRYGASDLLAVPAVRRDGSQISCEFTISMIKDEDGRLLGLVAILRDVTARRKEEKALKERLAELEKASA